MNIKLLAIFALATASLLAAKPPLNVYVLAGQSNMVGKGVVAELPAQYLVTQPHLIVVGGTASVALASLVPGQGENSASFGIEVPLGLQIATPSAFVKYAINGTNLANNWRPGSPGYATFLSFVQSAVTSLSETYAVSLAGFIWIQGESDAFDAAPAAAYLSNLTNFINTVRVDLGSPALPFIVADINQDLPYVTQVRSAQHLICVVLPGVIPVSTAGLSVFDGLHYTTEGYLTLGLRVASALLQPATVAPDAPLLNLSVRNMVRPSDGPLIVGFVAGQTCKLMARVVGPTLSNYDVPSPLRWPGLRLYRSDGTKLDEVAGWDSSYAYTFNLVGAFSLTSPADTVLLRELPPGVYSIHAFGLDAGAGNALVEIYLIK